MQLSEMSDEMLEQIANLDESRICKISKDDLRMDEQQLLWDTQLESDVLAYWNSLNAHWEAKTLPKCTCADHEINKKSGIGFMADPKYNPYCYNGQPCSLEYYEAWKAGKDKS